MKKKDYELVINDENLKGYEELYEAKSDLDDNNQLKLLIINTISLAAGCILSIFLIKNMPNTLAQFMPLSMFATSLPISFVAYNIIKLKQIKSLREEYPYINIDIPKNIIKRKLEECSKQKELSNIDEKAVEKTTEDITDDIMIKTCDIASDMTKKCIKDEK
ncbi:MAG: hypothetical protein J6J17_01710 [Bacilli bacterium]|nr:hypothetical protein [Bacilli bacterium]